jgi:hydroxylamine reductase (hybrid-cluster protein)
MSRLSIAIALMLASLVFHGAAAAEATLADHRRTFDTELSKIEDEETGALAALLETYGSAVGALVAKAQANGELDVLLLAKEEQNRFQKEKTVPNAVPDLAAEALNALRQQYHGAVRKAQSTRQSKTLALAAKYVTALCDGVKPKVNT